MKIDYFTFIGLPRLFAIDMKELDSLYFAIQRRIHPDQNFTNKIYDEHLELSIVANEAYITLRNPVKRAEHMLFLENTLVDKDCKLDPDFLEKIMEYQEQFVLNDNKVMNAAKQELQIALEQYLREFDKLYCNKEYVKAGNQLLAAKYISKLLDDTSMMGE
jgi:Fe-S protein assembly co-chaperone HscB